MNHRLNTSRIIWKAILLLAFILINISFLKYSIQTVASETSYRSFSETSKRLDSLIAVGDYNTLKSDLMNGKLYSKEFDLYYEIADGYNILCDYKVYAASNNTLKANETKELLQKLFENSKYEKNKLILKGFIDEAS